MGKIRVAVLMGGTSAERDVSLSTGRQIMAALDSSKYTAYAVDVALTPSASATATLADIVKAPTAERPDVVFIALHGRGGEDGTVQGMLDLLGLAYTGSGVLASALAMDKATSKRLFASHGVPVPVDVVVTSVEDAPAAANAVGYPAIVKPNREGSTFGCSVVRDAGGIEAAVALALGFDCSALIERYVRGVEITVGLLGDADPKVLPIVEIVTPTGFYDYEAKYAAGGSTHIIPARISEHDAELARDYAVRCHRALGCCGMSRVDMIVADGVPWVLEANTIPGMTPTSLLPDAARHAGIAFPELLDRLIEGALQRRL